ncbi:MAG: hypothetical protein HOP29_00205 [Phycisphaerales bacterium]|nr:hypothetical protein [Phycisphaerales bacterium]
MQGSSSYGYSYGRSSWGSSSTGRAKRAAGASTSGYKAVCAAFTHKIASYRTLCSQATGSAASHRPSPTTLNQFGRWIEKGAVVRQVSAAQVRRWAKAQRPVASAGAAKTALTRCFGKSAIKAVATAKANNSFLVACAPTVNGRKFNLPR